MISKKDYREIYMLFFYDLLSEPGTMFAPLICHEKGTILAAYSSMHFGNLTYERPCYLGLKGETKNNTTNKNGKENLDYFSSNLRRR